MRLGVAILYAAAVAGAAGMRRPVWTEIPEPARVIAGQLGINASNYAETLDSIDRRNTARLNEGDWDDLIYYMLQSRSFTVADPVEPARSAIEFVPSRQIPPTVRTRIEAFLVAIQAPANERQQYLSNLHPTKDEVEKHYARAMQFLHEKEVRCREHEDPQACIAQLYTNRGLSTDTSEQAFRSVEAAAGWIGKNRPRFRARRVLILGPGVDFAPRTALREDGSPRVYQPDQVRHLLQPDRVDCVDINPLVISYARSACASIYRMNIATGSLDPSPGWDLIVATNVLLYLDDAELLLAMNNVRHMLNPNGIFLHNDARYQVDVFGKACGLPVVQFGEIVLDDKRKPPLTDRYVLHEPGVPRI
jgi:hypothetical protein